MALETAGPLAAGADEGLRLVDALAEAEAGLKAARNQEKELEARREALTERLIAWAREHGFEGLKGTAHRAEIRPKEVVDYPKAGDELREAFEAALREAWAPFVGTREELKVKLEPLAPSRDEDEE